MANRLVSRFQGISSGLTASINSMSLRTDLINIEFKCQVNSIIRSTKLLKTRNLAGWEEIVKKEGMKEKRSVILTSK